ncbi:ABC transporter ATP-binding protein [Halieaceae bacterium IMCC14734]|uniref:ABC transporter ATP-binding protein n=1 Tax=Candidatus Litorirhabdus singularis TaxID=2518993 RepID=A0ABT3TEA8_9GAMM|nr:ABC transporter ATP-binding protein [Candidatus Litorirhabdus singularis]MCX2980648.1 ABC transporter ATP-binding protein [Candidatus Litorirhabdus singularis]
MLELDNVVLNYRSGKNSFEHGVHNVLNGVSLSLYKGETLGVIGKNGCGKTTILRLMAGIFGPTAGTVRRRANTSAALLTIGLGFKPQLSGRSNALLSAMLQGSTRAEAESCLEEIKAFSELGDGFEEPVKTYSSGMRSRLGFTTALMTRVDILMIDEVLAVGDAQFRAKAEAALKERITGEQTVVFVSHQGPQVQSICDRAIWLDQGKIAAEGDAESVLKQYTASIKLGPK